MKCGFCGTEIRDQGRFCGACGKSTEAAKSLSTNTGPIGLSSILGVLFILGAILPYLLQTDVTARNTYLYSLYVKYNSVTHIAAINSLMQFSSFLSPLFYFSSSAVALYMGLLLLKKEDKITVPVIICGIVHVASILYSAVVNLIVCYAPKVAISLYTSNERVLAAGEEIMKAEPNLLYFSQNDAICRAIISAVLIAAVVLFLKKKQTASTVKSENTKGTPIGGIVMILSLSLLSVISTPLRSSAVISFGNDAFAANATADNAYSQNISTIVTIAFTVVIAVSVVFNRVKFRVLAIPVIGAIVIFGLVGCLSANTLLRDLNTPVDWFAVAANRLRGIVMGRTLVLIALFSWLSAVSRNKVPMWLQIVLPVSLPVLYAGIEIAVNVILVLNSGISYGIVGASCVTIVTSLLCCNRDRSCA